MREGTNPTKENPDYVYPFYHKVIVPVYIPELKEYFSESLDVLKISLNSLVETIHDRTCICVVNNGSCKEVEEYLLNEYQSGRIHQLIMNRENLGKVDSIIPIANGAWEELITISDADVLFLDGWIESIELSFSKNYKLGYCSPCPVPFAWANLNNSTLLRGWVSRKISFKKYLDSNLILKFAESIGKDDIYKETSILLEKQFGYNDNAIMILGAGHFVGTFHKSILKYVPKVPSLKKMRGNSMFDYLDNPIEKSGLNRLATNKILCHHIGNKIDDFILEQNTLTRKKSTTIVSNFTRKKDIISFVPYKIRFILGRLIKRRFKLKLNDTKNN